MIGQLEALWHEHGIEQALTLSRINKFVMRLGQCTLDAIDIAPPEGLAYSIEDLAGHQPIVAGTAGSAGGIYVFSDTLYIVHSSLEPLALRPQLFSSSISSN